MQYKRTPLNIEEDKINHKNDDRERNNIDDLKRKEKVIILITLMKISSRSIQRQKCM